METPGAGQTFVGWSGGCSGTGSCGVTLNADTTVGGAFGYNLAVTIVGSGSVVVEPGRHLVRERHLHGAVHRQHRRHSHRDAANGFAFNGWMARALSRVNLT